jgi:hypothetical protein
MKTFRASGAFTCSTVSLALTSRQVPVFPVASGNWQEFKKKKSGNWQANGRNFCRASRPPVFQGLLKRTAPLAFSIAEVACRGLLYHRGRPPWLSLHVRAAHPSTLPVAGREACTCAPIHLVGRKGRLASPQFLTR